ncbi:glycosyl transferase [Photobacterium damselae]|uniref:glycosyl transferase n=1 Tax=Photobacterium damselae TaxID=38293 RepID=UPI0035A9910A
MSNSFNFVEKKLANFLSSFPAIKKTIKKYYSYLSFILNRKDYRYKSKYKIFKVHIPEHETFFGYYDKCPDNGMGNILVYGSKYKTSDRPSKDKSISLFLYDLNNNSYKKIEDIKSFNWQQGSRAHWLSSDLFIFNNFCSISNSYISKVYSIKNSKVISKYKYSVQDSYSDKYFLSINYSRLMALRPDYGYRNLDEDKNYNIDNLNDDGIWYTDISSNSCNLLLSLSDIVSFKFKNNCEFKHKVNHVMISPNGEKFIFMHRYLYNNKRYDRLLLANKNGELLSVLAENIMVSHCAWIDNNQIIGYLKGTNNKNGYWIIDINTKNYNSKLQKKFDVYGDGHPTTCPAFFVTDTYPNKSRYQKLLKASYDGSLFIELGEFFHGFEYNEETRCDLHPRLSHNVDMVFFDSVYTGERNLHYLYFSEELGDD